MNKQKKLMFSLKYSSFLSTGIDLCIHEMLPSSIRSAIWQFGQLPEAILLGNPFSVAAIFLNFYFSDYICATGDVVWLSTGNSIHFKARAKTPIAQTELYEKY